MATATMAALETAMLVAGLAAALMAVAAWVVEGMVQAGLEVVAMVT